MNQSQVTIIVTQRERFSYTQPSLESIYELTTMPFQLIYIDGNSPSHIHQYLETKSREKGFTLIRREQFLAPNQARNLALNQINTPYVVFIDNDVLVTPHWLENLVRCAEETQAWVVAPLYLEGKPEDEIIHMAAGFAHFRYKQQRKTFFEKHRFCKRRVASVKDKLQREETELVEFHCALVRTAFFKTLGLLDEQFLSAGEHFDLCLAVCEAGGTVYFEPSAVISYVLPTSFEESDLPFFLLRWSDEWNRKSLKHFQEKWLLAEDDPFLNRHYQWLTYHRQLASNNSLHKRLKLRYDSWLNRNVLSPLENQLNLS
ncbi:MAG: glycosyltransferase [Nostoc sp.]|uniref:glycosyltransferase family 2 protein n=1 Tax=Nostoc sp. TaxID=1180 RepID=UPI002FF58A93